MTIHTKLFRIPRSPFWQIRYTENGDYKRKSTGCKLKKDAELYQENLERRLKINDGLIAADNISLKDLIDKVVTDYKLNDQAYDRVEYSAIHLYKYFGENKSAMSITANDIDNYKLERKKTAKNATINRELAVLRRGYNLLNIRLDYKIRLLEENNVRTVWMEHWQYLKLLENASSHIIPVIKFMYFSGWRKSKEVLALKWSNIDLLHGEITLDVGSTKNKEGRTIFMNDEIKDMFNNLWNRNSILYPGCDYIFERKGKPIKDFRTAWKNSLKRAGLEKFDFHPHDMRRVVARALIRSGVPQKVAQDWLGHKTLEIYNRYNLTSEADKMEAAKKLTEYRNNIVVLDAHGVVQGKDEYENMVPPEPLSPEEEAALHSTNEVE